MGKHESIRFWPAPLIALGLGMFFGSAPSQEIFVRLGLRPGLAIFAMLNLLLPAITLVLAWRWPRHDSVWASAFLIYAGWLVGTMFRREPMFWQWTPGFAARTAHPAMIAGVVIVGGLGSMLAPASRLIRDSRTPRPPEADEGSCPGCGYSLIGIEHDRCPECGITVPGFGAHTLDPPAKADQPPQKG